PLLHVYILDKIEELAGLKRSDPKVGNVLKAIGMKCRKVGMLPAKANSEKQEQFKQEKLDPVLEEAKAVRKRSILWMQLILCWRLFWASYGLLLAYLFKPRLVVNASMFRERWMRLLTN
ncbi:MAG: hypothetical protein P8Y35_03460, partial [Sulfurovaceae bacterium]